MRYWQAFNFFKGACANRSCLKPFAGANPAPNMALIGTVLQQTFMRQMADLVAGGLTGISAERRRGAFVKPPNRLPYASRVVTGTGGSTSRRRWRR